MPWIQRLENFIGIRPENIVQFYFHYLPPAKVQQPRHTTPTSLGHCVIVVVFALAAQAQLRAGTIATSLLATLQALCSTCHALVGHTLVLIVTRTRSVLVAHTTHTHNVTATHTLTRVHHKHLELGADGRRFVDLPVTVVVVVIMTVDLNGQQQQQWKQRWRQHLLADCKWNAIAVGLIRGGRQANESESVCAIHFAGSRSTIVYTQTDDAIAPH